MSDVMLHGVLNMPPEVWGDCSVDKTQRYFRYMEASRRIEDLNLALIALTENNSEWAIGLDDATEKLIRRLLKENEIT